MKLMKSILIILVFFLFSCSSSENVVKERDIQVLPPPIEIDIPTTEKNDTVYAVQFIEVKDTITNEVVRRDTVIDIRYLPLEKRMIGKIKPDTVHITIQDTVKQKIEIIEETSWLEKLGYMFLGVLSLTAIFFLFKKVF